MGSNPGYLLKSFLLYDHWSHCTYDIINHLEWNCNYISFERINWQIDTNSSSKRIYHDTRSQNVNVSSLNLTILAQNSSYDTTKNRKKLSIDNWVPCSGMLLYVHHRDFKTFFHPAKFDNFKDEKISDFKTVSVSQRKNLLDWKLVV